MSVYNDTSDVDNLPRPRKQLGIWPLVIVLLGLALLSLIVLRGPGRLDQATDHPGVGQPLSDLRLEPLIATSPLRLDDIRGHVTLINFWGPWCMYCRMEFPELVELHERIEGNESFRFVSVSCSYDEGEPTEQLKQETQQTLDEFNAKFPSYGDPNLTTRQALVNSARLENFPYPLTVLLDRNGIIRGLWLGYRKGDVAEMEQVVSKLLEDT